MLLLALPMLLATVLAARLLLHWLMLRRRV
jgi:hypothetical protein